MTERAGFGAPKRPWKTIGSGVLLMAAGAGIYAYLAHLEAQEGSARIYWLIAILYNLGGKPLAAGFFFLIGLVTLGLGIAGVANKADEDAALRILPPVSQGEMTGLLMPALEFGPEDLAANRQGFASPRQQAKLGELSRKTNTMTMASVGVTVLMFGGIGAYLFLGPMGKTMSASSRAMPETAWVIPAVLGAIVLITAVSLGLAVMRARQLGKGKVSMVQGNVHLSASEVGAGTRAVLGALSQQTRMCVIKVGGETFYVTEAALAAFKHNAPYRLYFVRHRPTHFLLSAESLGSA